ncbi:MAG: hypothetical protein V2A73_18925 [Pseudomonadota bacterium]
MTHPSILLLLASRELPMNPLWLLRGDHNAPGWHQLEQDSRAGVVEVVHFDRDAWALMRSAEPPNAYQGLVPTVPPDGLYLDTSGKPLCVVGCQIVASARDVIRALGAEAEKKLAESGDPELALERLGRIY